MIKASSYFTAIALIAALPSLSNAQSVATSLSVSFGENDGSISIGAGGVPTDIAAPSSLSFASASGAFAVASSVANQNSTGAIAGASDNFEATPFADVSFDAQANAYVSSVIFPAESLVGGETQTEFELCVDGLQIGSDGQSISDQECGALE